jgi:hypothetical protein
MRLGKLRCFSCNRALNGFELSSQVNLLSSQDHTQAGSAIDSGYAPVYCSLTAIGGDIPVVPSLIYYS